MSSRIETQARAAGQNPTQSTAFEVLTRVGFVSRGVIYIIIGWLAIEVATHATSGASANQKGALETIDKQPLGHWLLIVVAIGLGAYAIWRFVQASAGHGPEGGGDASTFGRISAAASGCGYAAVCALAVSILLGSSSQSSSNPHKSAAGVLGWPGGQWIVGIAGLIFIGVALFQGYKAITLERMWQAWHGRATLPPRPMVLSFDDGYRSQVTAARPILATRRWPGVLNLDLSNLTPSWGVGRAGSGGQWPLVGRSIARSLTHPDLTALHAATLKREVAGSRAVIRRRFGVSARFFCYPSERCGNLPRSASPRRLSGNSSPARPP